MSFWAFVDLCLLAAGAICVAFSIIFRMPNLELNFTLNNGFLLSAFLLSTPQYDFVLTPIQAERFLVSSFYSHGSSLLVP